MAEYSGGQKRRIATYERVSSEDQRERATIKTQSDEIARHLQLQPEVELVERYVDDGVSGTVPMAERPSGHRLMADAARGQFDEVWVFRIDRLGRDDIDPLVVWRELEAYGVKIYSVTEGVSTPFEYTIRTAMNAEERRTLRTRTQAGLARAAREGRYCGGIVPFGYAASGEKGSARLVPSEREVAPGFTEAGAVVRMYERLALDGWSCRRVAEELNALDVPPTYARDGRLVTDSKGKRKRKTKGVWTAQRVRNTVTQPIYKGVLSYGRRSKRHREVITSDGPALVPKELWEAAQATLRKNRLMAKNTDRIDLLSGGVVRCGHCGRRYSASWTKRDGTRYRCNGAVAYKQMGVEKCEARSFRGSDLEPAIWRDIERWLRNPGGILDELGAEARGAPAQAVHEAELATLQAALDAKRTERDRLLDLYQAGDINIPELKDRIADVGDKISRLEERIADLEAQAPEPTAATDDDLLEELRRRLEAGLDNQQRKEIIGLLAEVVMHTEHVDGERKRLKAVVTYRFPGVANACTGRGSSPPPA